MILSLKLIFTLLPVGGVLRFPLSGKEISKAWAGPRRSGKAFHLGVTPTTLRARYNLTAADIGNGANNSQAVVQVCQSNLLSILFESTLTAKEKSWFA